MSPAQAKRILIVDDIEDNLSLLQAILMEEGYEVDISKDGKSALAKIEASPPDLLSVFGKIRICLLFRLL